MQKKVEELKVVLEGLVLPGLSNGNGLSVNGNRLVVILNSDYNPHIHIEILEEYKDNNYSDIIASILVGQDDWYIETDRYKLPTVIAATELVDIVVEKVLGMSCGYRIGD